VLEKKFGERFGHMHFIFYGVVCFLAALGYFIVLIFRRINKMKLNRIAPSSEDDLVGEGEFFQDLSLYWLGEYLKRANLELS
jgi:hypothetical protein